MKRRLGLLMVALALGTFGPASAQSADDVRGGWIADVDGTREIYILKVRGNQVTGVFCTDCENFDNLAFVRNGTFDGGTLLFQVYHDRAEGGAYTRRIRGQLVNGELQVRIQRQGTSQQIEQTLRRAPASNLPAPPIAVPNAPAAAVEPVEPPPAPPEPAAQAAQADDAPPAPAGRGGRGGGRGGGGDDPPELSAELIEGVWTAGEGPAMQHFMFRRVFRDVLGLACGPCDNPSSMAIIDNATVGGTNLFFDIVHEQAGGSDVSDVSVVDAKLNSDNLELSTVSGGQPNTPPVLLTISKVGGLQADDEDEEPGN